MQDLQQAATKRGMDFDSYLNVMKNAGLKEIGDTEQPVETTQPLQQTNNQGSSWFEQALQAGRVNADLYDDADAIFDVGSSTEVEGLSDDQLKAYISLIQQSQASAAEMEELNKFTTAFQKYNSQGENWAMSTINAIKETGNVKGFAQSAIQSFRSMANE